MFSFIGWEAVSHLAGELRDPQRQLPRAIFAALGVVVVLYLGLAVATIGVLGSGKPSSVPLAELMEAGLGAPGRTATAVLAVLLTIGTMNAYVAAAVQLSGALAREGSSAPRLGRPPVALAALAGISAVLLGLLAADVLGTEDLIHASGAAFVAVYVSATAAGAKLLAGGARVASGVAFAAVVVVFAFAGAFVAVPAAIGAAVLVATRRRRAVAAAAPCPAARGDVGARRRARSDVASGRQRRTGGVRAHVDVRA